MRALVEETRAFVRSSANRFVGLHHHNIDTHLYSSKFEHLPISDGIGPNRFVRSIQRAFSADKGEQRHH